MTETALRWQRLGERSGVAEIDAAIDAFRASHYEDADDDLSFPVAALRHPLEAEGMCSSVSKRFAAVLAERGLTAYDSGEYATARFERANNPLRETSHGPDDFGYTDRIRESDYDEHSATVVEHETGVYVVDFTAAQYGYTEFPLVQKLDREGAA